MIQKSDSIKTLMGSLIKVQGALGKAKKEATNPFYKSKYASLESVYEAIGGSLIDNGLVVTQHPTYDKDTGSTLTTILCHAESGEYIESTMKLLIDKNNAQGQGSALTYARRYSVCSILGILQEDDDGNSAAKAPAARTPGQQKADYNENIHDVGHSEGDYV